MKQMTKKAIFDRFRNFSSAPHMQAWRFFPAKNGSDMVGMWYSGVKKKYKYAYFDVF